jgi:hypothetical protein
MTVNDNESNLWGWMLDVPGRSELGVSTYLGADVSERCVDFCNEFIAYLETHGFVDVSDSLTGHKKSKGGRPPFSENEWARQQMRDGRDKYEVRLEWLEKRSAAGRPKFPTPKMAEDAFRKAIK